MQFVKPIPFKEAVEKLGKKSVIGSKLKAGEWAQVPLALRDRAFFSSRIESVRFLQGAKDFIDSFLQGATEEIEGPDGNVHTGLKAGSRAQFVKEMREFAIANGLGPLDPKDKGTVKDITSEKRLSLIFNTQTQAAHDYGYWKQGMDPGLINEFPAQRFIREAEVKKPRFIHIQNEGVVRLKTDLDFWMAMNSPAIGGFGVPWGPWGFNSGMGVEDVDRGEAELLGLINPGQKLEPIEKDFNERLQASVRNLDPKLVQHLKSAFGSQVTIKDGAIWWKGDRQSKAVAVPKKPKQKPAPETPADPGQFPESLDDLEPLRKLGGSTGAILVRNKKTGGQFVMKRGNSPEHIREEFTADEIYRSLNIPVPEARLYQDAKGPVKLARFVEGTTLNDYLRTAKKAQAETVLAKLREGFSADALLGNWDVAGLALDNILVDKNGIPWRIDNGGSLRFRAQGARKTSDQWNPCATDIWTMRDTALNPSTAKIFEKLTIYDIGRQIAAINEAAILSIVTEDMRSLLAARLANMKAIAAKALEYEATNFKPQYADSVTKHMMGLRKANAFARMADNLTLTHPGSVIPVDKNGTPFDHLRTPKSDVVSDPSQRFFDDILQAVKTINAHHDKGDTAYNTTKITKALGWKAELEKLARQGTGDEKAMAKHYLGFLDRIVRAQGDISKKIGQFTKFNMPLQQPAARSVTAELAGYMNANGGDWKIIQDWAAGQGQSSKSYQSQGLKYWLMQQLEGVKSTDFYAPPTKAAFTKMTSIHGDKFTRSFEILHAFVQELLGRIEFQGNDRNARLLRILRTESNIHAVPFAPGTTGVYKRGVNESGSIFAPVFGGTRTVTAVPHTRVTGIYFLERTPGNRHTFFLVDSENEVTYIAYNLKTYNAGVNGNLNLSPGTDHTKWEL